MTIFETFKCLGQNLSNSSCQFWNGKSIPLQILHHSSLSWYITPLWILRSYFSNFGLKDPINIPILRLSIALVKICYIPHVLFETTSQFFIKFCITLYNLPSTPTYLRGRICTKSCFNPLSANSTKWPYTLKQHSNYRQIV